MARQNNPEKVNNFRITIVDDASHKQIKSFKVNRNTLILTLSFTLVIICLIIYSLIAFTPIRTTIPGYPDARTRKVAVQNALRIDSLETIITRWELYADNLGKIVDGENPTEIDSTVISLSKASLEDINKEELARQDSLLRMTVRLEEQFGVSDNAQRNLALEGMHLFSPLSGVISQGYDKILHPYVDITAPANSVVMSVLDGTVIFAGWNDEAGYTIQIQHSNNIVSIYKHNQKLLKKTGDKVSAGSSIAIVGNTGTLTTGDHLHFELWYNGEAVDPTRYINFSAGNQ